MKAELIFPYMNPKKLAKILEVKESKMKNLGDFLRFLIKQWVFIEKWCWE